MRSWSRMANTKHRDGEGQTNPTPTRGRQRWSGTERILFSCGRCLRPLYSPRTNLLPSRLLSWFRMALPARYLRVVNFSMVLPFRLSVLRFLSRWLPASIPSFKLLVPGPNLEWFAAGPISRLAIFCLPRLAHE